MIPASKYPTINGVRTSVYNAHVLEYSVGEVEYSNGYFRAPRSAFPVPLDADIGLRPVSITMDFEGDDRHVLTEKISNLTAQLHKKCDLSLPDGFHYWCFFEGQSTPTEKAPWILQVEYSFQAIRHGPLRRVSLEPGAGIKHVHIDGNYRTPVRYIFSPETAGNVSIGDITVNDLKAEDQVVIDGLRKVVTANGVNVFGRTDMTEFPKMEYGANELVIAGDVNVAVEYYPLYM